MSKKRSEPIKDREGHVIQMHKEYGVGIDCHSKFLQISVIVRQNHNYVEFQDSFSTDPDSIDAAFKWVLDTINTKSIPAIQVDPGLLSYAIESTSTYHLPVVQRWKGVPEIVNPRLAGPTHRKTDCLDATMLARQNADGMWKASYIPSTEIWTLRSLISKREDYSNLATKTSNQINSTLLKFGISIGKNGSVTKNAEVRKVVEDLISDCPSKEIMDVYPNPLPGEVKNIIREAYENYDEAKENEQKFHLLAVDKVKSLSWETGTSSLPGDEMLKLLQTVPGVGPETALSWLSNIITPRRFENSRAVSAYCGLDPSLKISAGKVTSQATRGGNKLLHSSLCFAGSNLMGAHSEPFGIWGYKIFQATGKWKKGTNAVGRRIATSLFYVQSTGNPFDYSKYTFMDIPEVVNMSIHDLSVLNPEFHRYLSGMQNAGILTSQNLVDHFYNGTLKRYKGLSGKKLQYLIKEFVQNQDNYKKLFESYNSRKNAITDIVSNNNSSINELVEKYPNFSKFEKALHRINITCAAELIKAYYSCELVQYPRLGTVFMALVNDYIDSEINLHKKEDNNNDEK